MTVSDSVMQGRTTKKWVQRLRVLALAPLLSAMVGCGSQAFAPGAKMDTANMNSAQARIPSGGGKVKPQPKPPFLTSQQPEALYVIYNDGCSQDQVGDCNGSIFPYLLNSDGSPGPVGPGISLSNPISITADKVHSKIAVETWADSTGGWYSLQLFEAESNGNLRTLAATALEQQHAIRFHPNGHWLFAGPGPLDQFRSTTATFENALDMERGLQLKQGSVSDLGFVGTDAVVDPAGVRVFAAGVNGEVRSYTIKLNAAGDVLQLQPGWTGNLAGNSTFALPPSLAMHPLGKWLYAQSEPGGVDSYGINSDGSLGQPVHSQPGWLLGSDFDPTGNYAFFAENEARVNQLDGSFGGSITYTNNAVIAVQTDPSGQFVYTVDVAPGSQLPEVSGYTLDVATGKLTPLPTSPWRVQASPQHIPVGLMVVNAGQ